MLPKKDAKANLENKRLLFFEIGLIIAMLSVILVFRYGGNRSHWPAPSSDSARFEDEAGYENWNDLSAMEIITGTKIRHKPKIINPDKIEIVKEIPEIEAGSETIKDRMEPILSSGSGGHAVLGNHKIGIKKGQAAIQNAGNDKNGGVKFFYVSFVPDPNPDNLLNGVIIIPYTAGIKMDSVRFQNYTLTMESWMRSSVLDIYKPLVIQLPLDYFAFEQHKIQYIPDTKSQIESNHQSVRDILLGHEWKTRMSGSDYCTISLQYKDRKEFKNIIIGKRRYEGQNIRNYYLSNTRERYFDQRKIGTKENGRYIISETDSNLPEIVEILEISDSVLVTRQFPDKYPIKYHPVL